MLATEQKKPKKDKDEVILKGESQLIMRRPQKELNEIDLINADNTWKNQGRMGELTGIAGVSDSAKWFVRLALAARISDWKSGRS